MKLVHSVVAEGRVKTEEENGIFFIDHEKEKEKDREVEIVNLSHSNETSGFPSFVAA